jgi:serine/threonine protein phosphatase PrpC
MGGHEGGAAAAALAATGLASLQLPARDGDWSPAIESLSDRIAEAGRAWATPDMGATLAALVVDDAGALVVSIGDCMVARMVDGYLGVLTVLDRAPDPRRAGASVVTQSLGGPARHLDARPLHVTHGPGTTRYLLCTDGLHDHVPAPTVRAILDTDRDGDAVADALMEAVLAAGAPDNVSIVVADVVRLEPPG